MLNKTGVEDLPKQNSIDQRPEDRTKSSPHQKRIPLGPMNISDQESEIDNQFNDYKEDVVDVLQQYTLTDIQDGGSGGSQAFVRKEQTRAPRARTQLDIAGPEPEARRLPPA